MTYDEDEASRAIAQGRINPYGIQKKFDEECVKPLAQIEARKVKKVIYYTDEKGNIRRKKE